MINKFISFDSNGNPIGWGKLEQSLSAGQIACTDEQYANPMLWQLKNGVIVGADIATLLEQAKATQIAMMSNYCFAAISAGVTSAALGSSYLYPTSTLDQLNLTAAVTSSQINKASVDIKCQNTTTGVWDFVTHTQAQALQVGNDVFNAIKAIRVKKDVLDKNIADALTTAQVQAVTWQ